MKFIVDYPKGAKNKQMLYDSTWYFYEFNGANK